MQCTAQKSCMFCADPAHFMGSCPHMDGYIQSGRASRGTDGQLYLPDGKRIPRVPGTRCLRKCLDRLPVPTPGSTSSVVTAGILSVSDFTTDAILDIEPSVFLTPVAEDWDEEPDPVLTDPEFQEYLAHAWANFQANKKDKGKRVRFDSVEMLPRKTGHPGPHAASVSEELLSPAIEASQSKSLGPPKTASTSSAPQPSTPTPSLSSSSSIISSHTQSANPSSTFTPQGQFRYSFPLEDEAAPKCLLDHVLNTMVLVPVRELISVAPDVRKQLKDLSTAKPIPVSTNTVQVNKLAGRDPGTIKWTFGDRVH